MNRIKFSAALLTAMLVTVQPASAGWSKVYDFSASWLASGTLGTATTDAPLVSAGNSDAVIATFDKGTAWINLTLPFSGNLSSLSVQDAKLWLGTQDGQGIAYSANGVTWEKSNDGIFNFAGKQPKINDVLYVGGTQLLAATSDSSSQSIFATQNSAKTWLQLSDAGLPRSLAANSPFPFPLPVPINALAKNATATVILAASDAGVYRSTDGQKWTATSLSDAQIKAIAFTSNAAYALADSGLFVSTDGGNKWASAGFTGGTPVALHATPSSNKVVVGSSRGVVATSTDSGQSWTTISDNILTNANIKAITRITSPEELVYVATSNGIYRMDNSVAGGLVLSPSGSYSFGKITVGQTAPALLQLKNNGAATATLGSVSLKPPFAATTDCGATLASGATCSIFMTFAPTEANMTRSTQVFSDTLVTTGFSLSAPLTVSGTAKLPTMPTSISDVVPGTTVTSNAFGYESGVSWPTNVASGQFNVIETSKTILGNPKYSINGGAFTNVLGKVVPGDVIRLQVTAPSLPGTLLTVGFGVDNPLTSRVQSFDFFRVKTSGVTPGSLSLAPSGSFNFGKLTAGQSASTKLVLTNTGMSKVDVSGITLSPPFAASSDCPSSIEAGKSCNITLVFSPLAADAARGGTAYSATLQVAGQVSGDRNAFGVPFIVSGTALPKALPTVFSSNPGIEQATSAVSNEIDPQLTAPANISIVGGEFSINGGSFGSTATILQPGDTVRVRHTSANQPATESKSTLTIGAATYTFTSKTTGTAFVVPSGNLPSNIIAVQSLNTALQNNKPLTTLTLDFDMQAFLTTFGITSPQQFSAAASYNLYVAGILPGGILPGIPVSTLFLKDQSRSWVGVGSPLAAYLENVSNTNKITLEVLSDFDFGLLSGVEFYVGMGTSDAEMLSAKRYRAFYKVP